MSTPIGFTEFSRQRGLAPDGRCKAFAAGADGTGWGEGVGLLLLERLSDARRHGHRVLAVVKGSAVNQDGASNGLSAPNGPSQERVIRQALANAGLAPSDVDVVEAHGTGTTLGDPIEAQALLATYGRGRPGDRPLWLGSIKSNLSHTGAAAGVAGVVKMVEALRRGVLPATLHVDAPSPLVDWSSGAVALLTEAREWPETGGPRRAAISSFGISGTNAHVILEAGDPAPAPAEPTVDGQPWVLSARGGAALRARAGQLRPYADRELGWSLATARAVFEDRAVVLPGDRAAALAALAGGEPHPLVVTGSVAAGGDRPVFVFPGQGPQWTNMAVDLLASSEVFAARLDECAAALAPHVDWQLREVLCDPAALERVDVVQPVLWAVMVSLTTLWESVGVKPAAVVGHSQGEIAAAVVAGALSLADGARVVAVRSRALRALSGSGGMVSVNAPADELQLGAGLWVAVVNAPDSCVIAGEVDALHTFVDACPHRTRWLPVDYASHTPHVEALQQTLRDELAGLTPTPPTVPIYSCVTAGPLDDTVLDAEHWYTNLRQPVRFADTITTLTADGYALFIEPSPHPTLTGAIDATAIGTLRRDEPGPTRWHTSLAEAWTAGATINWQHLIPATNQTQNLPTYPFQHQHYWLDAGDAPADPAYAMFWDAIDGGDLPGLAESLGVDTALLAEVAPALAAWRSRRTAGAATDRWRYRVEWHPITLGACPGGRWLAVLPDTDDEWSAGCLSTLTHAGVEVVPVRVPAGAERAGMAGAIRRAAADAAIDGIVSLLGADERSASGARHVPAALLATVALLLALEDAGLDAPLWTVTRDPATAPVAAQMWALGRVAALEYPRRWGGLIGVTEPGGAWPRALTGQEDQVVVGDDNTATARRLVHAPLAGRAPARPWQPHGTVLVTGGTGALGAHVARWLARSGAAHVVLASRGGGEAPGAPALAEELGALGARVTIAACDVADRAAVADLVGKLTAADETITAAFHTAGMLHVEPLAEVTERDWLDAYAAKVGGALHLESVLDPRGLEAFVLFSSNAGIWGSGGQAAYAAANAALDAIARRRRAAGLPATSVAWGAWAGDGMAVRGTAEEYLRRRGVSPMRPERAIGALHDALDHDETVLVVADVDWERFTLSFTSSRPSPLLTAIPECQEALRAAAERGGDDTAAGAALVERLAVLPPQERANVLTDLVRRHAAAVLGHASLDALPAARPFKELGFDSLTAVELRNRLTGATGRRLPASLVYDHPTAAALAQFLLRELVPHEAGSVRVLADLDRLAAVLDRVEADDGERMRLTMRLRTVLARWEGNGDAAAAVGDELETATDDEIFSLVDNDLGVA